MPFSRRIRTAASMSPFASCRARLQSIIGAPVWSRSSLTSAAEISAIRAHLLGDRSLGGLLVSGSDLVLVAFRGGRLLRGGRLFRGGRLLRDGRLLSDGRLILDSRTVLRHREV